MDFGGRLSRVSEEELPSARKDRIGELGKLYDSVKQAGKENIVGPTPSQPLPEGGSLTDLVDIREPVSETFEGGERAFQKPALAEATTVETDPTLATPRPEEHPLSTLPETLPPSPAQAQETEIRDILGLPVEPVPEPESLLDRARILRGNKVDLRKDFKRQQALDKSRGRSGGIFSPRGADAATTEGPTEEAIRQGKGFNNILLNRDLTFRPSNAVVSFLSNLDKVADTRMVITSNFRSPETNKDVKGKEASKHLSGDAVDFSVTNNAGTQIFMSLGLNINEARKLASSLQSRSRKGESHPTENVAGYDVIYEKNPRHWHVEVQR